MSPPQKSRRSQLSSTLGFLGRHRLVPFADNITTVLGCCSVFFHDTVVAAVLSPCRTSLALRQPLPSPFDAMPSPLIAEPVSSVPPCCRPDADPSLPWATHILAAAGHRDPSPLRLHVNHEGSFLLSISGQPAWLIALANMFVVVHVIGSYQVTGEHLIQRKDDTAAIFKSQLQAFHKQTEP